MTSIMVQQQRRLEGKFRSLSKINWFLYLQKQINYCKNHIEKSIDKGNKMVFDQIAELERKKQGGSIDKTIDCITKLGINRSQVEKGGSVSIHNRNLQVLVTEMFKINRGIHYPL